MEYEKIEITATDRTVWSAPINIIKASEIKITHKRALQFSIEDVTGKKIILPLDDSADERTQTIKKETFIKENELFGWTNLYLQSATPITISLS